MSNWFFLQTQKLSRQREYARFYSVTGLFFSARLYSRSYFLFRSIINPIIFFLYLVNHRGNVVFNDFDQSTSFLWVPLVKLVKRKRIFSVVLHDPDRNGYFKSLSLSVKTMQKVMSVMDIAFYHEVLPDRPYYRKESKTSYIAVPHGLYDDSSPYAFDKSVFCPFHHLYIQISNLLAMLPVKNARQIFV